MLFSIEPRIFVFAAKSLSITLKAEGACSSFMSETTRWQNPRDHHLINVDFLIARKFKVTCYRDVQTEGKDRGQSGPGTGFRTLNGPRVKPTTFLKLTEQDTKYFRLMNLYFLRKPVGLCGCHTGCVSSLELLNQFVACNET
jgi:hypothetical protein